MPGSIRSTMVLRSNDEDEIISWVYRQHFTRQLTCSYKVDDKPKIAQILEAAGDRIKTAGDVPVYEPRAARFFPARLPEDVMATGGIVGDGSLEQLLEHGRAVGREAAQRAARHARELRQGNPCAPAAAAEEPEAPATAIPELPIEDHPELFRGQTHGFVDFSEDVSSADIFAAAHEGYDSVELVKRFTTATMGMAQGKLETVNAVALLAEATGRTIAETGTTRWRPPYSPMTLGGLAGRNFEPVRVSPMHPWHQRHGAQGDPGAARRA